MNVSNVTVFISENEKLLEKAVVTETRNATKKNECLLSFFRSA